MSSLRKPLLNDDEPAEDRFMWVRLIATVTAVSLGSSLQFGFATVDASLLYPRVVTQKPHLLFGDGLDEGAASWTAPPASF